ncbi:hypothetical protein [Streptomyces virginiae]|uniref:hypothetical protein n=1 Tax=Streptomyces virginiae TaxID=1961 RepID=UPI0030E034FC
MLQGEYDFGIPETGLPKYRVDSFSKFCKSNYRADKGADIIDWRQKMNISSDILRQLSTGAVKRGCQNCDDPKPAAE